MTLGSYEVGISKIATGGLNLGLSNVISSQWALSPVLYKNKYRELSLHIAGNGNPTRILLISRSCCLLCSASLFLVSAASLTFCSAAAWDACSAAFSAGDAERVNAPPVIIVSGNSWSVTICKFNVLHNSIIAWLSPQYDELNINFLISSTGFKSWNGSNFFVSALGLLTVRILFSNNRLAVSYTKLIIRL